MVLFGSWNRFVLQFEAVVVVTDNDDHDYYSEENIKSVLGTKLSLQNKILNKFCSQLYV